MPALSGDNKGFTPDEEFVAIATRKKTAHARAKVIILQMLDQLKHPDKKYPGIKFKLSENPSVSLMYGEMCRVLRKEHPEILKEIMADVATNIESEEIE